MLVPLKLLPGIFRNGTEYQAKNRWYDANLVRFHEGTIRPMGGWRPYQGGSPLAPLTITGVARGAHSWRANNHARHCALGTQTKLYAFGSGTAVQDITPAGLTAGIVDATLSIGYGMGDYGVDAYGVPRQETGESIPATTWSLDNFGEYLVACSTADGKIYVWDLTASPAAVITPSSGTVPTGNIGIIVTPERFLFALGAGGNPRKVQWCDQEDYTAWAVSATTQAGSFELQTNSAIRCALSVRSGTLILTEQDAHFSSYIGPPYIYSFECIAESCGVISRKAAAIADNFAVWMGDKSFFLYDGYVKPLPCEVSDYVFSRMNVSQRTKVYAIHDGQYSEVRWYYPASNENDSYVVWNYRENHWTIGSLNRTCGVDRDVFANPLQTDASGNIYEHEVGFEYDSASIYLETGPLQIQDGEQTLMVRELIPDEATQGDVQARFSTKWYPNGTEYDYGPYPLANPTSVRFSGRQFKAMIEGAELGDWRLGEFRFDVVPAGGR